MASAKPRGVLGWHPFIFFSLLILIAMPVSAQPNIEQLQPLNFGTLALPSNSSVSTYTFPRSGSNIRIEGSFVLIEPGVPGQYRLTGFPADTSLQLSIDDGSLTAGGSGIAEPLQADQFDFPALITDSQGEAQLTLGARLSSTGNGGNYEDAPYSGTTVLRIDYWHPDAGQYVSTNQQIDLNAALSTTLQLEEVQALNFGTLFARSSNSAQANLTLNPDGKYSLSEPGDTRLVSIDKPAPGVIRVSGAAPNYALSIEAQSADVLLEHTQNPASAPHFVLSTLATSPDGSGETDKNGELVIHVGGTLKTELTASPEVYPSGSYEGTYELTVSY